MWIKVSFVFILFFRLIFPIHNELYSGQSDQRAPIDSTFHNELTIGLNQVSNNRFIEALALFDSLQQVFPHHPAPYFYKAATYQSWMLTYRFNKFHDEFQENAKLAIDKGNKLLETDNDPWLNFYVGAAHGFIALHRFRQHNWIGAYFEGRRAIKNFNQALKKSPNLYDCYFGLGGYHYWRTAKSKFIKVVAFWMRDRRKLGLEQQQLSIDRGRYCPEEATHGLIIALYHHGDYDQALALSNIAMKLSDPPALGALYMRGRLMFWYKDWPAVQDLFQKILNRLAAQPYQSISYQVECKYWIAEALKNQNQSDKAYELVILALAQSKNWVKDQELENPLDSFDDIKKRLKKLKDNLEKEQAK